MVNGFVGEKGAMQNYPLNVDMRLASCYALLCFWLHYVTHITEGRVASLTIIHFHENSGAHDRAK